jgi:hypothetical protein
LGLSSEKLDPAQDGAKSPIPFPSVRAAIADLSLASFEAVRIESERKNYRSAAKALP